MFTRIATYRDFGRHRMRLAPFSPVNSNDNRRYRHHAGGESQRRNVLACRWLISSATGRPECIWTVNRADAAATETSEDAPSIVPLIYGTHAWAA